MQAMVHIARHVRGFAARGMVIEIVGIVLVLAVGKGCEGHYMLVAIGADGCLSCWWTVGSIFASQ